MLFSNGAIDSLVYAISFEMIGLDKTKTNMNVKGMSRITSSLTCKNFREHYLTRFSRQLFVCLIWGAPSSMFTQGQFCSRWDLCKKIFKLFSFLVRCLKETLWKVATDEVEMSRARDSTRDSSCKNFKKHTSTSLCHRLFVYVIRRALPSFFTQGHSCSRWNLRKTKKIPSLSGEMYKRHLDYWNNIFTSISSAIFPGRISSESWSILF